MPHDWPSIRPISDRMTRAPPVEEGVKRVSGACPASLDSAPPAARRPPNGAVAGPPEVAARQAQAHLRELGFSDVIVLSVERQ
jgi:hypothetical protein